VGWPLDVGLGDDVGTIVGGLLAEGAGVRVGSELVEGDMLGVYVVVGDALELGNALGELVDVIFDDGEFDGEKLVALLDVGWGETVGY
jgi:hypothetical protein